MSKYKHCYQIIENNEGNERVVAVVVSEAEYRKTLEAFGGLIVKMKGRNNYRRFPRGIDGHYVDYSLKSVY